MAASVTDPWRWPLRWADARRGSQTLALEADDAARERIAKALELPAVVRLHADLTVRPWLDGAEIRGGFAATVTQICGVSLDPFDAEVEGQVDLRVLPAGSANLQPQDHDEALLDPDAPDPPDAIEGEAIDLGAYVVEHLALALDPFPRKAGVAFEPPTDDAPQSPFAALAALKTPPAKG
jgi:hypothetical protein